MKLKLLDIDLFIEKRKLEAVSSGKYYAGNNRNEFDKLGIFSQEIFGRLGSAKRKKLFAYINLNNKLIHPEGYKILTSINPDLTKLIMGKEKYLISDDGKLTIDQEAGSTGVSFFIANFDKLNFEEMKTKNPDNVKFVLQFRDTIIIDKFPIMPAGIRDVQITTAGKQLIQHSEVNELYIKLINQVNMMINAEFLEDEIKDSLINAIQRTLIMLNTWIKNKIKGKYGLIRGGMLKKVVDYCARLVIVPDTNMQFGFIGIPWHICLKLFEPMFIHYILKEDSSKLITTLIQQYFNIEEVDINDIKNFNTKINENPDEIDKLTERELIKVVKIIVKDKLILFKRDPVENRDSWQALYVTPAKTGFVASLNSYDLCKNGGDYDGDTIAVYSLLTNQAQEQAKKLSVLHNKGTWTNAGNYDGCAFELTMDAAIAIYSATLK